MAKIEVEGDEVVEMAGGAADVLNLIHWYLVKSGRSPIWGAAILEGARRALLIGSGCCTCEACMGVQGQLAEVIADHLEMSDV